MANLILDNFYSGNETAELVGTRLLELFEELELNPVIKEDVSGKIGFRDEVVYDKKGYWKTVLWVDEAPIVDEFDTFVIQDKEYGPDKSYALNRYFLGKGFSSTAELWMTKHAQSTTLERDIKRDIAEIGWDMKRQHASIMIAKNNLMTKILTKGFSISAPNGPWSASPYGQPLFSAVHPIGSTGSTQSNIQSGALAAATLEAAVEKHRNMKDGKGNFMDGADVYKLVVNPRLEKTALELLSAANGYSPFNYSGTEATNPNFTNFFISEDGFRVELVVLKTLGQPDSVEGGTIGTDTMWFLINPDAVSLRGAFKKMNEVEKVGMYKDEAKNATFFKVETWFGAEFIYPECIVWSTWV